MLGNILHIFFVILLKLWFFCNMCLFFAFTTFDASIFWSVLLTRHLKQKLIVAFLIFWRAGHLFKITDSDHHWPDDPFEEHKSEHEIEALAGNYTVP